MYYVYVLRSQTTSKRYVGQMIDLQKRIKRHNYGGSSYTRNRGPWDLMYSEELPTRAEAMIREKFLKSGKGREFLDNLGQ